MSDGERVTWPVAIESSSDSEAASADHSLYQGTAGIGVFYLELYASTGETHFLERAGGCGHSILSSLGQDEWESGL